MDEVKEETSIPEANLEELVSSMTDFSNPHSIMMTSSLLMGAAMQMYSMVLSREDMQEMLLLTRKSLNDNHDPTVYH